MKLIALFILFWTLTSSAWAFKTVVIDAGHGGNDRGGSWGKVYESHLALDTAFRLERYLKMKGYKVVMTRRTDKYLSLKQRSTFANKYKNAIFVSVHINKASRTGATGIETFYYGSEGKKLGQAIQDKMVSKVKVQNRGLKYARFHVLRTTKIPAVLTEIGFVSNYGDRQRLKSGKYHNEIAKAIADGIAKYD